MTIQDFTDTAKGVVGVTASAFGVITMPTEAMKAIPAVLGCCVAVTTIWSIWNRNSRERERARLQSIKDSQDICHTCLQDGMPPKLCPYPQNDLPDGCLLKVYKLAPGKDPHHHKEVRHRRD